MTDDLTRRQPEDPRQINVNERWEVEYWTKKFGVSEAQLRECVEEVGTQPAKVAECLGK